jgi:hypothetical protein
MIGKARLGQAKPRQAMSDKARSGQLEHAGMD